MMIKPRERDAIIKSLAAGVVPTIGLHHIQVDRKDEIMAMIADLERVREGGASVRFVVGRYGTGKSFFLNLTKSVALAEKFVVMRADVTQKRRLASTTGYARNLYAELLGSMSSKTRPEGGAIEQVIEKWLLAAREKRGDGFDVHAAVRDELKPLQDMVGGYHFTSAITIYCAAWLGGDGEALRSAKKWLMGGFDKLTEAKGEVAIDSFISDKDIYDYLKLWGAFVRIAGFSGLLILLDEMGVLTQALTNNTSRNSNYDVVLHILNECLQGRVSGIGFLFAGAEFFLEDRKNGLMSNGALASRLAPNPFARGGLRDFSTPVIRLGDFSPEDLYLLLENIREVFAMGDKQRYLVPDEAIHSFMSLCAWSLGPEFYKTPRDAVKLFTGFLSVLEQNTQVDWQKLLDGTVIEKGEEEPKPEQVYDDDDFDAVQWTAAERATDEPDREETLKGDDEEWQKTGQTPEPVPANDPEAGLWIKDEIPEEPEDHEQEKHEDAVPELTPEPTPEAEPEPEPLQAATLEQEQEPAIASEDMTEPNPPAWAEIKGEPEADVADEVLPISPKHDAALEPDIDFALDSELEFELEFEPDEDKGAPLKEAAFAEGDTAEDGGFDFEFSERIDTEPDYDPEPGFELGPGPELYIMEPRPNLYDPNILYIMPDAGSSREVSLRIVKPELERAAVKEMAHPAATRDEEDMLAGHALYGNENDLKVFLPNLIARNPLIGMEKVSSGVHNDLVRMSGKILINAYNNYLPNSYEKTLLSVALINIAKRWASDDEDAFWSFICRQLGFEHDAYETLYGTMCNAIYETMKYHHRFFSQDPKTNKREFYATIMAHALASRDGMFAWFDLLSDFYRENLRGLLMKNDPAIGCLADAMKDLFEDEEGAGDVVIKGRHYGLKPGIITLLLKRPAYFKKLTEDTLGKIRLLSEGGKLENATYLDELLNCWFMGKSPQRMAFARPPRGTAATVADYGLIRPGYEVENSNSVVLVIPSVRLTERMRDCYEAIAEIYCGEKRAVWDLEVYGDEFAWTLSEARISLSSLSRFDLTGDLRVRVKIFVEGRMIYDSGTSLYRDMIIFDGAGEIPPRAVGSGLYSVFASGGTELSFDPSGDLRIIPAALGQMRAVKFTEGYGVTVNGRIACSDYRNEEMRLEASAEPVRNVSFALRGEEYDVWAEDFRLKARVPSGRDLRMYSFRVWNKHYQLSECEMKAEGGVIECELAISDDMIHDHVIDAAIVEHSPRARELYRRGFCVLPGFSVAFDRPYYFGGECDGSVKIESGPRHAESPLDGGGHAMIPFGEGFVRVKVPLVTWRAEPEFTAPDSGGTVWHGDIPRDAAIAVSCPIDVGCRLKIGGTAIERDTSGSGEAVFGLAKLLESGSLGREEEIARAELILESMEYNSSRSLFQICLRETFEEPPRFEMKDGALSLKNPRAFIGPRGALLEYSFSGRDSASYQAISGEAVISGECALPHGSYHYMVFSLPREGAADDEKHVIFSGSCILGDVDIFHFDNKLLEIRRVRSGFKEFFILPVYAENLEFAETKAMYDDGVAYPVYSGTCYYMNRDDKKVYFGEGFNPARIVIINGRDICLYKSDWSKPCLIYESRHKIVAAKPEADSGVIQYSPDFYEYEALEGN
jgi:hypothetical protein